MNQYWIIALLASYALIGFAGYEARGWQDKAAVERQEVHAAKDLGQGFARSITDTQVLEKKLNADKDPCLLDRLPSGAN